MAFEFLTDEHLAGFGRYQGDPSPQEFQDSFHLNDLQLKRINELRHPHTKLGFAIQLCTLKFLGTFLPNPIDVPDSIVRTLAVQLQLPRSVDLHRYLTRQDTRFEHQAEIRNMLGYKDFDSVEVLHLMRFLYRHLLVADGRPIELFELLTPQLVFRKVILPGPTILARLVLRVREGVSTRVYRQMSQRLTEEQKSRLDDLVLVPEGQRRSLLDTLRTPPTRQKTPGLVQALRRLDDLRALGVGTIKLTDIPQDRLRVLSRHALVAWAPNLAKLTSHRRSATLLAVVQHLEKSATDDALDIFDTIMTELALSGQKLRRQSRLRTLRDLDQAALLLRDAVQVLLDPAVPAPTVRDIVFARLGEAVLSTAAQSVTELASAAEDPEPEAWMETTATISRFLSTLLETIGFAGTTTAASTLSALNFLRGEEGKRRSWKSAPVSFIPQSWQDTVRPGGVIDQRAYQVCAAYRLHTLLKRREIFVPVSLRYGDPRAQLLQGEEWERLRPELVRSLGWSTDPKMELDALSLRLDDAYRQTAAGLSSNPAVRIELQDGKATLVITPLEAEPLPESLLTLRTQVDARLPEIDLSELLMEVHAFTGFAHDFDNVTEGATKLDDFATTLCAVLVAGACNIDLKAVAQPTNPALTLSRLNWVKQQYLRADTLVRANASLVAAQAAWPLASVWGTGETASADGLRFSTPLRNTVAAPNSKYFGAGRGVTYYALSSDQYTGLHGRVIPGTLRDSLYILGNLLEQQTVLKPHEVMSDTAGYSDVVFGLFHLLGYQFSPRIADIGHTRYWRMDRQAQYGDLHEVARHQINTGLIASHWDDLLRVAASLKQGTVPAPDIMRVLGKNGSLSGLGKAVAELGRIAKTLYLLKYVQDEDYRRKIGRQLNRGEARWILARIIFHGKKGELRQRYRENMEDQLGVLGLVVNAVAVWNTRYISASLDWIREMGEDVLPDDVARLSPMRHGHINVLGRYHFEMAEDIAAGAMRPLRDPDALNEMDWTF